MNSGTSIDHQNDTVLATMTKSLEIRRDASDSSDNLRLMSRWPGYSNSWLVTPSARREAEENG